MNIKNVTKTQLRDFVDNKISKCKIEFHNEIEETVTKRMEEALKMLLGDVSELERVASRFEDLLTEKIHLLGADSVPDYATIAAREASRIYKSHKYFLGEVVKDAMTALNNQNSNYSRFKCVPLMNVFNELNKELQPKLKMYREGLETLKRELHNAVSNENTGKQAYKALVALGLDMSDLPDVNPNLPAVVKLSVDVCVLNGNCEEKVS